MIGVKRGMTSIKSYDDSDVFLKSQGYEMSSVISGLTNVIACC